MTNSKTRAVSRLLETRHGIVDPQLAFEIVQLVMTPDQSWAGDKWSHPAVVLAKRITGERIPPGIVDEIISKLGDNPDKKRAEQCHLAMVKRGKAGCWYWLDDYAGIDTRRQEPQHSIRFVE